MMKKIFLIFALLTLSCSASTGEIKFANKEDALKYYMEKKNHPENIFQIKPRDMKVLNIDNKGGDDVLIINPNFCGALHGCGGGVFLCQGKEKNCADGYFCEANIELLYELEIKKKGAALKCKK